MCPNETAVKGSDRAALLRQQVVLAEFGRLALRSDDCDEILTEGCRLVREGLGIDLAKVMELQEDGTTLLVRAGVSLKPGIVGTVTLQAVDGTSEGYVLKTEEATVSSDITTETRFSYAPFLVDHGVRAVANVAIIGGHGRSRFGILQIDSLTPREFTDDDRAFLGSYANLIAAAMDRLRVIAEVHDDAKRLRLALEASELGSWELDLASGAVTSNRRHMQIFGYSDPLPAWSYDMFLSHVLPEDREHVTGTFDRAVETGTEWHFECRIERAGDGELRWIEAKGRTAGDRGGTRAAHLLGFVGDITARKIAEETQKQSHEALSLAHDALSQSHEALARSHEELSQSRDALETNVAERTSELTEMNATLLTVAEEREHVAEALRQSTKMEAVGQLTGGLAHDFNNLLAAISGSLEFINIRLAQGRTAELGRYVEAAMASANRAAALTHRLLAFARRQTLDPKAMDLNQLVTGMEDLFRRTVGPSIQLETKLASETWPIMCDPNQLESALLNLVINARDAMPDGGQLLIESLNVVFPDRRGASKTMDLLDVPPGDCVALRVTDTGAGMTPAVLARAFDPFFTTKPADQGTGLGLSMTYGFVRQSGGQVHLHSDEGQGTSVTIYLPRYSGEVEVRPELDLVTGLPVAANSATVLVVEDEPSVRMIIVDVLSDCGYTVLETSATSAALDILRSSAAIDLLLTDVGLPGGMNGRQLADVARTLRPDLKVLFITGYANSIVGDGLLEQGMQVITKPFKVDALAARVQKIIRAQAATAD